jgi:hypothetical protein
VLARSLAAAAVLVLPNPASHSHRIPNTRSLLFSLSGILEATGTLRRKQKKKRLDQGKQMTSNRNPRQTSSGNFFLGYKKLSNKSEEFTI